MRRRQIAEFLLAVLLLAACAARPADAETTKLADVAYGPDKAQRLDVYIPPAPHDAPGILMVHGGAWIYGDKDAGRVVRNKADHWLARGFIFITVNYRLVPDANPVQQADDVAAALAKVQAEAASWGGDPARVILMGHSAGAHLVALLAADPERAYRAGARPWLGTVVLDRGALDVTRIMSKSHYRFYDRAFGDKPDFWRAASPTLQLTRQATPLFLICSTQREGSCPPAHDFVVRAKALGIPVAMEEEDMSHREINEDLGLPGAYTDSVDRFIDPLVGHSR